MLVWADRAGRVEFVCLDTTARIGLPVKRAPQEAADELKALRDAAVTHVVLESRARDRADMTTLYERFPADVLPRL